MKSTKTHPDRILLIEDDANLAYVLQENLEMKGFEVSRCADGEEGLEVYLREEFDLCLIDVMLPKKDGFTLAKEIRTTNQEIPIIFLTAKSLKEDRIEGFKIGGDDYIVKPFSMEELSLRIQAVLKRTKKALADSTDERQFTVGQYEFDYESQTLHLGEQVTELTSKEAGLLRLLCLHRNEVMKRDVALKLIWGEDNYFNARSMDVFITKLRKYLREDSGVEIKNVHGEGFKLLVR